MMTMIRRFATMSICLTLSILTACSTAGGGSNGGGHDHGGGDAHGGAHDHGNGGEQPLQAIFSFPAGNPTGGQDTELAVRIQDTNGKAVGEFDINHEKLMHLIIVSRDLSYFGHIHPDYQGAGTFTVSTRFPSGGEYKIFADFVPAGSSQTTISKWIRADGKEKAGASIKPDEKLVKAADGKEVELTADGLKANGEATLTFTIRDEATKEEIRDLEPYLGAVGHVVILSDDAEHYLHVHPADEKATGPDAVFMTSFPHAGTYKIWGQFQHEDEVFTVPFVVQVP
ncbi:hypothetical protein [Paenibacillus alkalitolerans]|uniref:hypothetical protein n=1 Tax=Paenibacillus alkalitolerans TaxID=2799335 RepID=UPI001F3B1520|nr:hypothetical protein [Paenibacillus alkalitolerans]